MRTIPQLFEDSCRMFPGNPLIYEKSAGSYQSISYQEIRKSIYMLSAELIHLGIQKGDRIALVAEGSSKWLVTELAILYVGAISVPLSVKINEPTELLFRISHAECKYVFVSDIELSKIRKIKTRLYSVLQVFIFDARSKLMDNELAYECLIENGRKSLKKFETEVQNRWKNLSEDDLANISYTSGTTADPKGIMLSHRNYTANIEQACSLFDVPEWYNTLLILSWDHSFAHTVGLYVLIKNGASIAVVESGKSPLERLRNIPKNIKEIKPVFILSVPAVARSFKKNIESGVKAKGRLTEKLFNLGLKIAFDFHGNAWDRKSAGKMTLGLINRAFDKLIFSKIRENFGGRLQFLIGGGALLDIEIQQFFYAIGIPMYQGYGLTEASPVISSNTPAKHKLGTSGCIVENLAIKILDENGNNCKAGIHGEIVVKGENVMKGYWKNEKATNEALRDGWLYTGDLGYLDQDGFLYVLGRFKSLLIGNDGEKYSPEGIEEALVDHSAYIEQCMLYNNQNPSTVGLIVPSKTALLNFLASKSMEPNTEEGIKASMDLIEGEVKSFFPGGENENMFPSRWLPAAIGILSEGFTEENGMINSTLKMVRSKVTDHYAALIKYLYSPAGKKTKNQKNFAAIKKLLNQ